MRINEIIYRLGLYLILPLAIAMVVFGYIQVKLLIQAFNDDMNIGILLMSFVMGGWGMLLGATALHFLGSENDHWTQECGVIDNKE